MQKNDRPLTRKKNIHSHDCRFCFHNLAWTPPSYTTTDDSASGWESKKRFTLFETESWEAANHRVWWWPTSWCCGANILYVVSFVYIMYVCTSLHHFSLQKVTPHHRAKASGKSSSSQSISHISNMTTAGNNWQQIRSKIKWLLLKKCFRRWS